MDRKLMAQLGIRPIVKKRSRCTVDADVRMRVVPGGVDKSGVNASPKVNLAISSEAYFIAFTSEYIAFGVARDANRLYFWDSDKDNGFKAYSGASKATEKTLYVQSTDLYDALKNCIDDKETYSFSLKYSKDLGLYYIDLPVKEGGDN